MSKPQRFLAVILLIAGLSGLALYAVQSKTSDTRPSPESVANGDEAPPSETPVNQTAVKSFSVPADHPRLLSIPALDIIARVQSLGLTKTSAIASPRNINDAGWYQGSAKPGSISGAAFIDGHVNGPTKPGIFKNLGKLKIGSKVIVERGDSKTVSYIVRKVETVSRNDVDMKRALASIEEGRSGLTLMTCAGAYDKAAMTFEDRVIVYAVRI